MGSIFKGTTDEFKDVADAIRDINGEEEIYQWPEEYIAKLGDIKTTMTEYEDNYDGIIDAIKDVIKDEDPDDAEAIDKADVKPEDIVDAISGDGILIDEEEEEYTPSIVDIIADLKDVIDLYTEDFEVIEVVGDWAGLNPIRTYIQNQEDNHIPRTSDPNYAEKIHEIETTKQLAVYVCKTVYNNDESIICIPTRYIPGVSLPGQRRFSFALLAYKSETASGADFHFYDVSSTDQMKNLRIASGTRLVRVVLTNV